jgi:hypothetical protein
MEDRRIFERFNAEFPLRFINSERNDEGSAQVRDVSAKGLGIVSDSELAVDTPLEMWLDIPQRSEPLHTRGQVVWSRRAGAGKWQAGINLEQAQLMPLAQLYKNSLTAS